MIWGLWIIYKQIVLYYWSLISMVTGLLQFHLGFCVIKPYCTHTAVQVGVGWKHTNRYRGQRLNFPLFLRHCTTGKAALSVRVGLVKKRQCCAQTPEPECLWVRVPRSQWGRDQRRSSFWPQHWCTSPWHSLPAGVLGSTSMLPAWKLLCSKVTLK